MAGLKMNIGRATMNDPSHRRRLHRSVPPVHDITTLEAHQLRSVPTPTTMTKLPSVSERRYHQKLLAKVVGLDSNALDKANINSATPTARTKTIMAQTDQPEDVFDVITGTSLGGSPRLMRDGPNSKYGIRRQISDYNELELAPELDDVISKDSTSHHVTVDLIMSPRELPKAPNVTNGMIDRERKRNAPWVYCYKIKKDRQRITKILVKEQNVTAEQIVPSVL